MATLKRTHEQLRNHYEVEKALATKLKNASREERKEIFATMYDELFEKVPDHPRLTYRSSPELTAFNIKVKSGMFKHHMKKGYTVAEFAPGDCKFAFYLAPLVDRMIGIDISDQSDRQEERPANFEMILYDGYTLDLPENSVDVFYSDQLIEHIHPEEVDDHFKLVHRTLKPGGKYAFRIPHRFSGPHDISRHFADEPEGFHLNEPTYTEMKEVVKRNGFSSWQCSWTARHIRVGLPCAYFFALEWVMARIPAKIRRKLCRLLLPTVYMVAKK